MTKPRLKSFHDQIVDTVGRDIVSGVLPSGSQIPPEPLLAESLGVGRLAVREAMKVLASKGLVVIRPKTGTHVLPRDAWNPFDPHVLQWQADSSLDERFIKDLMELRRMIEPAAARIAATQASRAQIEEIRLAYGQMASAQTHADYLAADLRFHGAVLQACGNQFIRQLQGAISEVLKVSFRASSAPGGARERTLALALHEGLLAAIERRDPEEAARAVDRLIARASERIRRGQRADAKRPAATRARGRA